MFSPADVRAWALANGHKVGVRGRLPQDVFAAFLLSHPATLRALATERGLTTAKRGRLSATLASEVASTLV